MNAKTLGRATLALLPAALVILTSCSSTSQPPPAVGSARIDYTKGVPGGVIFQTFKTTATVTAIDQTKRLATLMGSDGKKFTVKMSPEVSNFDQVHVGDRVIATVTQKIVARIAKESSSTVDGAAVAVETAPKGDEPSGLVAETSQVTAKVIAIDPQKRTTTLQFENGTTEIVPIRDDVDVSRRQVGEQVVFRVTDLMAIRIEKP